MGTVKKSAMTILCWFCICTNVYAEGVPDFNSTKLTGDWGGERTKLAEEGITVDIDAVQSYQGVLNGGTDQTWQYGGSVDLTLKLDFQKMGLWPGAFIDARVENQFGNFVNNGTGALLPANMDGISPLPDYHKVAVPHFVFTQFLSKSFGVFFGKISTLDGDNNYFAGKRGKEQFMNQNFVLNPVAIRSAPLSALGGGMVFVLPDVYAKRPATVSFMVLGSNGVPNEIGWDDDFEDGESYATEIKLPTEFFGKEGAHTFGAAYNNKDVAILDQDPRFILGTILGLPVTAQREKGTWAFYYNFHQYLYTEEQDKTQGFGLFGRYGIADDKACPIASFYSIGLGGKGLLYSRDNDTYGVGYFYAVLSDKLPNLVSRFFGDSQGFEAFYNIEITKWLHLTPDFQIINPSNERVDTAYVAGIRARIDF